MDIETKNRLQNQLKESEAFIEKIKAELYAALGKVALLKELLIEQPKPVEQPKES